LPKEDSIEVFGKVVEKFKAGMFSIELEAGRAVLATMAGRLRRNRIKIMNGDRVTLELSPYDLTKGRITYRHKTAVAGARRRSPPLHAMYTISPIDERKIARVL
jgi:translation initiation factor IF-1